MLDSAQWDRIHRHLTSREQLRIAQFGVCDNISENPYLAQRCGGGIAPSVRVGVNPSGKHAHTDTLKLCHACVERLKVDLRKLRARFGKSRGVGMYRMEIRPLEV